MTKDLIESIIWNLETAKADALTVRSPSELEVSTGDLASDALVEAEGRIDRVTAVIEEQVERLRQLCCA